VTSGYPRDLAGYGRNPPRAKWPKGARVAVQFVLNYEEGGENSILHGDTASEAFLKAGHEIASHGWRWISYQNVPLDTEREHMQRAIEIQKRLTGERPLGWYTGRTSPNTRSLVVADGGFVYDADDYSDELPWYDTRYGKAQLIVPYTLDANDMRFATPQGFNTGDDFFSYLKDSFDVLYAEGAETPRMMSVGLHCRLTGRPGRLASLKKFLDYISRKNKVWITRRIDIARHWLKHHPYG